MLLSLLNKPVTWLWVSCGYFIKYWELFLFRILNSIWSSLQ